MSRTARKTTRLFSVNRGNRTVLVSVPPSACKACGGDGCSGCGYTGDDAPPLRFDSGRTFPNQGQALRTLAAIAARRCGLCDVLDGHDADCVAGHQ